MVAEPPHLLLRRRSTRWIEVESSSDSSQLAPALRLPCPHDLQIEHRCFESCHEHLSLLLLNHRSTPTLLNHGRNTRYLPTGEWMESRGVAWRREWGNSHSAGSEREDALAWEAARAQVMAWWLVTELRCWVTINLLHYRKEIEDVGCNVLLYCEKTMEKRRLQCQSVK